VGVLSIDRRVRCEVLDQRGTVVLHGPRRAAALRGTLREVPAYFERGAPLTMLIDVGASRFEVFCKIVDGDRQCLPGAQLYVDVVRAGPADVSKIEPFDMVSAVEGDSDSGPTLLAPPRSPAPITPPFGSLPPTLAAGEADEDEEPTGVVGTLKEMPVSELVQSLQQNRKDALVEVKAKDREHGTLGLVQGRLVFARTASKTGNAAFYELLGATRGAFRIRYGRTPDVTNIIQDTSFLLLEGMRLLDEEKRRGEDPIVVEAPGPFNLPKKPAPATVTPSGKFAKFFDEAGVKTPPPIAETLEPGVTSRFSSLVVRSLEGDLYDLDAPDDDVTNKTSVDKRRKKRSGEKSDPTYP
jgi:hypothetical protein